MKKLLNNKEDFKNWRLDYFNDILNSYEECEPKEYPCVVVYRTYETDYCLRDRVDYEFVYLNDVSYENLERV